MIIVGKVSPIMNSLKEKDDDGIFSKHYPDISNGNFDSILFDSILDTCGRDFENAINALYASGISSDLINEKIMNELESIKSSISSSLESNTYIKQELISKYNFYLNYLKLNNEGVVK